MIIYAESAREGHGVGKCGRNGFPANLGSSRWWQWVLVGWPGGQRRPERDHHPPPSCPLPVSCFSSSSSSSSSSGIRAGGHSPVHCGGRRLPTGVTMFSQTGMRPPPIVGHPHSNPRPPGLAPGSGVWGGEYNLLPGGAGTYLMLGITGQESRCSL